jgi:hypothetical protein
MKPNFITFKNQNAMKTATDSGIIHRIPIGFLPFPAQASWDGEIISSKC